MENDFFFFFNKNQKLEKERQKLIKMHLTLVFVRANAFSMYDHAPSRTPRLAHTPAYARREQKIRFSYSRT